MTIEVSLCYYYWPDKSRTHHQNSKRMDHRLLMMGEELLVNLANHRHCWMTRLSAEEQWWMLTTV